ncbi:DUF6894 family protein [Methylobacterium oxalidis]|uniref:DUF6894 family protein n=1 Tax=Methylobacterium oxalidis TaxID=944322 RepID=UPI0033156EAD
MRAWSESEEPVPRYFFDIVDGGPRRDDTGTECAGMADVRGAAMKVLPDIAREEIPGDGDRRFFTVVARDEAGEAVYTATLSFAGIWLKDRPKRAAQVDAVSGSRRRPSDREDG